MIDESTEYRQLQNFTVGDSIIRHGKPYKVEDIKREEPYIGLWYKDHGVPRSVVDREDATYLAQKKEVQG